jgi:hypothetical protein
MMTCAFARPTLLAGSGQSGDAFSSEYTSLTQPFCKTQSVQVEGANSQQVCPGVHGFRLLLLDSDGRMSVTVVSPKGTRYPLDFWDKVTPHFSSVGKRAEWRIREQGAQTTPVAIILPLEISEDAETAAVTSYLVVARIDPGKTCVVGKFKNDAGSRIEARNAADSAAKMNCLSQ